MELNDLTKKGGSMALSGRHFTKQQRQVINFVIEGRGVTQIAEIFGLPPAAIRKKLREIFNVWCRMTKPSRDSLIEVTRSGGFLDYGDE